eukprot:335765-Chlamydomonas_euryale.AAC.1
MWSVEVSVEVWIQRREKRGLTTRGGCFGAADGGAGGAWGGMDAKTGGTGCYGQAGKVWTQRREEQAGTDRRGRCGCKDRTRCDGQGGGGRAKCRKVSARDWHGHRAGTGSMAW